MKTHYTEITRWGKVPAWWLFHPDINLDRIGVLAVLTTYANEQGVCTPSQSTLAKRLKRSRPWVNRIIAELVEIGLLEKRHRSRDNGGTSSCEYMLRFAPPDTPVPPVTLPDSPPDTGCHREDTNQVVLEQKQHPLEGAREKLVKKLPDEETNSDRADLDESRSNQLWVNKSFASDKDSSSTEHIVPEDWEPQEATLDKARKLFPDGDLRSHIALFISRCRSKGYQIAPAQRDETWLSWFIEDQRKATKSPTTSRDRVRARTPLSYGTHRYDRFSAWAEAAKS